MTKVALVEELSKFPCSLREPALCVSLKVSERVFPRVHVYSEQYMCTVCTVPGGPEESHSQSVVCCGDWSQQECDDIRDTLLQIEITTETQCTSLHRDKTYYHKLP